MQTELLPPKKRKDRGFDPSDDGSTFRLVSSHYDSEDSEDSESEDSEDSQDTRSDPEWTPSSEDSDNPDNPEPPDTPDTQEPEEPVKEVPTPLLPLALDAPPEAGVRVHEDARRPKFLPANYTVKYTSHAESANPTPEDAGVWTPMASFARRADGGGRKVKPVAASAKFGTRANPTMGHSQRAKSRYGIPKAFLVPSTAVRRSIVAALEKACSAWVRGQNKKPMPENDSSWVYVSRDGKTDPRPYRFVKQGPPQGGYHLYCPSTYPPSEEDGSSHYYALTTTELRDAFLEDSAFEEHNAVTKKQLLDVKNHRKKDNVPTIEMRMKIQRYTTGRNAREMAQAAIGATEKQVQQQQLEQQTRQWQAFIDASAAFIAATQQQLGQQTQTSVAMDMDD